MSERQTAAWTGLPGGGRVVVGGPALLFEESEHHLHMQSVWRCVTNVSRKVRRTASTCFCLRRRQWP